MKITYFATFFAQRCNTLRYSSRLHFWRLIWSASVTEAARCSNRSGTPHTAGSGILQIETNLRFQAGTDRTEFFVWQILVLMQKLAKYQLHLPIL